MTVIIANVIDFLAALLQVGSGSIQKKSKILLVQILQLLMQGVSILLLGGITGAVSNVLSCYRNYLCYKEKLNTFWKATLIAVSLVMTILFNNQGWLGAVPFVICTAYILLMGMKDPIKFKILVMLSFVPWMIYHFVLKSYVGALFDAATIVTNVITLRAMIKEKNAVSE